MLPRPLHPPPKVPPTGMSPPPFGGGRRGGLGTAPRCRQQHRGRTAGRRAGTKSAETWSQQQANKGFESCEKAKQWKLGHIRTKFVRTSYEFHIFVNLCTWREFMCEYRCVNFIFDRIPPNMLNQVAT